MQNPARAADERWMRRAIELARLGEGLTRPNPPVGAVIVRKGRQIAEGFHERAGGPHAEIVALNQAGPRAKGADLYVTLEPCSTWGRTPPCTDAILRAGIRRVICGAVDPNPRHAGRGFEILKRAGVEVQSGILEAECEKLIEPFATLQRQGRPFVTLKLAMSLDGRIADARGRSRWITGEAARQKVHELRARVDGILVGRETAALDNPSLLPNPSNGRQPFRIVLDPRGELPLSLKMFRDAGRAQTIAVTSHEAPSRYAEALMKRQVRVIRLRARNGRFALRSVLKALGDWGLLHVLCEGGGKLADSLLKEGLVDEAWFFLAPKFLGSDARPAIGGTGWKLVQEPEWRIEAVEEVGRDILIRARPIRDPDNEEADGCLRE